jgi:hypothetical protein
MTFDVAASSPAFGAPALGAWTMTRVESSDPNHLILLLGRLGQFKGLADLEPLKILKTEDVHSLALSKNTATSTTKSQLPNLFDLRTIS